MSPVLGFIRFTKTSIASRFNLNFSKPFRLILLTVGIVSVAAISLTSIVQSSSVGSKAQANKIKSEDSVSSSKNSSVLTKEAIGPVAVEAAGRGMPYLNLQDGREMTVNYRGDQASANALQSGVASSRTLAAADLDGDGAPDLVTGYANGGTGIVTVQKGNPEGFAPKDDSVFQRMHDGYNPPSLMPAVETYPVSSRVDFLQLGDFNQDGRRDVLVASRDGGLRLLPNDGQGGLGPEQLISLPGSVTALTS